MAITREELKDTLDGLLKTTHDGANLGEFAINVQKNQAYLTGLLVLQLMELNETLKANGETLTLIRNTISSGQS